MNKNDIKKILLSMRTAENEKQVNNLLGKVDLLTEEKLQTMLAQIGDNEENIREYIQGKIDEKNNNIQEEHTPINDMFTYGVTGNCIHLHMPVDLREMMSEKGIKNTVRTVNLYLLDAIERIRKLQNDGFYKFKGKSHIYMISPILLGKELKFLKELDFETNTYNKKQLKDEKFVSENEEAKLAIDIFGSDYTIGTAKIGMDVINSKDWQIKRIKKVKEFEEKGIKLNESSKKK